MEKAHNRQRVLLRHLLPNSSFSSAPPETHQSAALSVSLYPFSIIGFNCSDPLLDVLVSSLFSLQFSSFSVS